MVPFISSIVPRCVGRRSNLCSACCSLFENVGGVGGSLTVAEHTHYSLGLRSESRGGLFESPHRLAETLAQAVEVLGVERNAVVCRELTKKFEKIRRGSLGELAEWAVDNARGEITVVLDGGSAQVMSVQSLLPEVEKLVASGMRLKGACKHVTEGTGVSNRDLYQAALQKP